VSRPSEGPMAGRLCLVTGATSGIGRAAARQLAEHGARVWLVARDAAKGRAVLDELGSATGRHDEGRHRLFLADLSRPTEVRRLVDEVSAATDRLDVLLNDAAVWPTERRLTEDGIELAFATNVLAYLALSVGLEPLLRRAAPSRIVNVASSFAGGLDLDDLEFERRRFDGAAVYKQTKQADRLLSWRHAERLAGTGVTVNACHPGVVDTSLNRDFRGVVGALAPKVMRLLGRSPAQGADTPVWLATAPELERTTGTWFDDRKARPCGFRDPKLEAALWQRCADRLKPFGFDADA
jgi:retinol dehydrogenase-12